MHKRSIYRTTNGVICDESFLMSLFRTERGITGRGNSFEQPDLL